MRFFNKITLQTPESVELEFNLAGIGNRALAYLIDYLLWLLTLALFLFFTSFLASVITDIWLKIFPNTNIELWLAAIFILIFFVIYVGYFVFFETLWQGQTPGKRFAKIRVIRDDGRTIGLQQATLRSILRPIDDLFFIGTFMIMLGSKEKRLGDLVAGTIVIEEEQAFTAAKFPISEPAKRLAKQLPEIANLSQLKPDEFAIIREYLQRRHIMSPKAKINLSQQLTEQIKEIIEINIVLENIDNDKFLEAVYLAYQKIIKKTI